jgi:hypothetical protein
LTIEARTANHDDVNLMIKLYELRREERMREARSWFGSSFKARTLEEFHAACPPGSEANASFRMIVSYWDMVGSFLTAGVLNQELFFQSGGEMLFVWERIRDVVPQMRQSSGNPLQYRNFEASAAAFIEWWNSEAPGAYDIFSRRLRG